MKLTKAKLLFVLVCLLTLGLSFYSCSSRRTKTDMITSEVKELKAGRIVFKEKCQRCHPDGEGGVGPPINSIHLPKFALKARVRSRAFVLYLGRMPAFDKHEISKQEMKELLTYLKVLEKSRKG